MCWLQVGSILFTVVIVTVHLEIASVIDHWTPFHHASIWCSVCECPKPHLPFHLIRSECRCQRDSAGCLTLIATCRASMSQVGCPGLAREMREAAAGKLTTPALPAVIWILYLLCYGEFPLSLSQAIFHLFIEVLAPAPVFWLIVLVMPFACVLPGFFIRHVCRWALLPCCNQFWHCRVPVDAAHMQL